MLAQKKVNAPSSTVIIMCYHNNHHSDHENEKRKPRWRSMLFWTRLCSLGAVYSMDRFINQWESVFWHFAIFWRKKLFFKTTIFYKLWLGTFFALCKQAVRNCLARVGVNFKKGVFVNSGEQFVFVNGPFRGRFRKENSGKLFLGQMGLFFSRFRNDKNKCFILVENDSLRIHFVFKLRDNPELKSSFFEDP